MLEQLASAVLVLLLSIQSCVTVDGTGRRALNFVPDDQMNKLGLQAFEEIQQKEKLSKNKRMTAEVKEIGARIAKASGADFDWEFILIESDQVNAFCLPGGKVAVYTGILKVAKNRAGLAAVMGHEVAHAIARHGAERMSQGLLAQAGLTLADLTLATTENPNRGGIMAALGLGAQFGVMLPFSRKHETEADVLGLQYMAKAGYDPTEAALFWKRMQAASKGSVPEFMSTHPSPSTRSETLKNHAQEFKTKYYAHSDKQENKIF